MKRDVLVEPPLYQLGNWKAGKTGLEVPSGDRTIVPTGELEGREDCALSAPTSSKIVPTGELEGREDPCVCGVSLHTIVPTGELEGREDRHG